jgi:hypothetical protein
VECSGRPPHLAEGVDAALYAVHEAEGEADAADQHTHGHEALQQAAGRVDEALHTFANRGHQAQLRY